jgi:hypothetical protein
MLGRLHRDYLTDAIRSSELTDGPYQKSLGRKSEDHMHRNLPDCRMRDDFRRQRGRAVLGHGHKIDNARGEAGLS